MTPSSPGVNSDVADMACAPCVVDRPGGASREVRQKVILSRSFPKRPEGDHVSGSPYRWKTWRVTGRERAVTEEGQRRVADLRRHYRLAGLAETDLAADP